MKHKFISLSAVYLAYLIASTPAQANIAFNIQPATVTAASTGNAFDVTVTNTGPGSVDIGGFSFGFSVSDTHIVYTGTTIATTLAPYVFTGDSLFGPAIATTIGAQTVVASDLCILCGGSNIVGAGSTVDLGHVLFNVLPGATGVITETFIAADDSLSTPGGASIPVTMANSNTITISTVPEPSTWALLGAVLVPALLVRKRIRRF